MQVCGDLSLKWTSQNPPELTFGRATTGLLECHRSYGASEIGYAGVGVNVVVNALELLRPGHGQSVPGVFYKVGLTG